MVERILCLIIGYGFGCFLTAAVVVRKCRRCSVFTLGTGNPGMANVMAQCGLFPGILVLIGDVVKTVLAFFVCYLLFREKLGTDLLAAYAGLGAVAGHDFPFWHRFVGGKGVSCTCAALFCIHPLYGLAAMIVGLLAVLITKKLAVGAVVIPAVFLPAAYFVSGKEVLILCLILTALMVLRNLRFSFTKS
ncbi:MAG: glycerol-3-phosphate acyltransferase [Lachnospiraceae bacterium]|nr:glycerol-3-phosphate acyltransferase [Lachnospiraceae bacterium]